MWSIEYTGRVRCEIGAKLFLVEKVAGLPRIIPKAPVFRLGLKAISNLKIKKSPVL